MSPVRLAIVQTKPRKGDVAANVSTLRATFAQLGAPDRPDLIVLPEAALTGYFLEGAVYDLAFTAPAFAGLLAQTWRAALAPRPAGTIDIVAGFYENDGGTYYNAAMYLRIEDGVETVVHVHRKIFLPTYGVFDEERFVSRGRQLATFATCFGTAAILICEDAWHAIVPTLAAVRGARLLIIPSASPGRGVGTTTGELESIDHWHAVMRLHAVEHGVFIVYAGLAGFEGGKGMTGSSCVIDPYGRRLVAAPALGACILRATLDLAEIDRARASLPLIGDLSTVLPGLLRDLDAAVANA